MFLTTRVHKVSLVPVYPSIDGAYLSVDFDYWDPARGEEAADWLKELFAKEIPIFLCGSHEELLQDPELLRARELWNIDYHSDHHVLCDQDSRFLTCGNWIDHIPWRAEGCLVWYHPFSAILDYSLAPFRRAKWGSAGGFREARQRFGLPRGGKISAAGISIDPFWFDLTPAYTDALNVVLCNIYRCTLSTRFAIHVATAQEGLRSGPSREFVLEWQREEGKRYARDAV